MAITLVVNVTPNQGRVTWFYCARLFDVPTALVGSETTDANQAGLVEGV